MAIEVTAVLAGSTTPQVVQVEVTGLESGDVVSLRGATGLYSWPVRGGVDVVTTGAQLIRRDNLPALNAPVIYTATVGGVQYSADPISVPHSGRYLLSSLDGSQTVKVAWGDNGDPLSMHFPVHLSRPHGRLTPVAISAPGGGESGAWQLLTETPLASMVMRDLLRTGQPLVMRTSGDLLDFPPARVIQPTAAPRALFGVDGGRMWTLAWAEVSDPLASLPVTAWTLGDFSTVWATMSAAAESEHAYDFATINTFIASIGGTFADINRYAWDEDAP